jgi:tetratricopeptide (TPR) repeat protein
LAELYRDRRREAEAEPLFKRSLTIREKLLGPEHPEVGASLVNLAILHLAQRRPADAEAAYQRAIAIWGKAFGPDHPVLAPHLRNLAGLYRAQGRHAEADPLAKRAQAIAAKAGPRPSEPPRPPPAPAGELDEVRKRIVPLIQARRLAEALPLAVRYVELTRVRLGDDHAEHAMALGILASAYGSQGRFADAEPLARRSLAIAENAVDPNRHQIVGHALTNLGLLQAEQGRYAEAEVLLARAVAARETALGPEHSEVAIALDNLGGMARQSG